MTKEALQDFIKSIKLAYANDFLTVEYMAEHYNVSTAFINAILNEQESNMR